MFSRGMFVFHVTLNIMLRVSVLKLVVFQSVSLSTHKFVMSSDGGFLIGILGLKRVWQ